MLEWWIVVHFAATEPRLLGIPAHELNESWLRVSVLTPERIDREVPVEKRGIPFGQQLEEPAFDVRFDVSGDGRPERVVVGVYDAEDGTSGSFLLVAEGSDERGWKQAFLSSHAEEANFSYLRTSDGHLSWWPCFECDFFATLRLGPRGYEFFDPSGEEEVP